MTIFVHLLGGSLGIISGFVALSAVKGARLHRGSGTLFVYAMIALTSTGTVMAALTADVGSVIGGLLTAYLVITALTTVRPPTAGSRWQNVGALLLALAVGLTSATFGFEALASPKGTIHGIPAPVFFMFALLALLGSAGDLRMMRSGALQGAPRLARHLWRMCFALWIATSSFFLGPRWRVAKVLPEPLLRTPVLMFPVVLVIVAMFYWLWRVRIRRGYRGIGIVSAPEAM
jgi:uncharacterized membrane protein